MAGFAMMGLDYEAGTGPLNLSLLTEYRGNSYAIGGDTNAVTIANFMKRYNPNVKGASVLSHLASFCHGTNCNFPLSACKSFSIFLSLLKFNSRNLVRPLKDNLNAGQSGAIAMNLDYELNYLIPRK